MNMTSKADDNSPLDAVLEQKQIEADAATNCTQGSQFVGETKNSTGVKRHKVVHVTPTRDVSGVQAVQQADEAATFVTPGIFRRKLSKQKQPKTDKEGQNDAKENREFRWSIDQMAVLQPVHFDESELSLPPEDWDPNNEHNVTQPSAIEQFWSRKQHIVPSPDVVQASLKTTSIRQKQQQQSMGSSGQSNNSCTSTPPDPLSQSMAFCSPNFPGITGSGSCPSSTTSQSNPSVCSPMHTSPCSPQFKNQNLAQIQVETDEKEFEAIERSFSLDIDPDSILADLGEQSGGFVRRKSVEDSSGCKSEGIGNNSTGDGMGMGSSLVECPPFLLNASPIKPE